MHEDRHEQSWIDLLWPSMEKSGRRMKACASDVKTLAQMFVYGSVRQSRRTSLYWFWQNVRVLLLDAIFVLVNGLLYGLVRGMRPFWVGDACPGCGEPDFDWLNVYRGRLMAALEAIVFPGNLEWITRHLEPIVKKYRSSSR